MPLFGQESRGEQEVDAQEERHRHSVRQYVRPISHVFPTELQTVSHTLLQKAGSFAY